MADAVMSDGGANHAEETLERSTRFTHRVPSIRFPFLFVFLVYLLNRRAQSI